jgi:hypothetical protein
MPANALERGLGQDGPGAFGPQFQVADDLAPFQVRFKAVVAAVQLTFFIGSRATGWARNSQGNIYASHASFLSPEDGRILVNFVQEFTIRTNGRREIWIDRKRDNRGAGQRSSAWL